MLSLECVMSLLDVYSRHSLDVISLAKILVPDKKLYILLGKYTKADKKPMIVVRLTSP